MELEDRKAVVYLTVAGFEQIGFLFGMNEPQTGLDSLVRKTDAFGLWLSPASLPVEHVVVVPWHFVAAIEFQTGVEPDREIRKRIGF